MFCFPPKHVLCTGNRFLLSKQQQMLLSRCWIRGKSPSFRLIPAACHLSQVTHTCPATLPPWCTGKRFPERSRGTKACFGVILLETGIIQLSPPGLNLKNSLFCFLQTQSTGKREPSVVAPGRAQTINSNPRALHWGRAICRAEASTPTKPAENP